MNISGKCVVSIHFKLTNTDGKVLDSSEGQDPLVYLHGTEGLIPGLEKALEGKTQGDSLQVTIPPEEAYGPENPDLIQKVPKEIFTGVDELEPGMIFETQDPEGSSQRITVQEIEGETVTINANHPLAGQTLHFDVSIEGVREATEEEIDHGHAH